MPGEFLLDLGCEDSFNTVELVNTHNGPNKDRSTERFQIFLRYRNLFTAIIAVG